MNTTQTAIKNAPDARGEACDAVLMSQTLENPYGREGLLLQNQENF